MRRMAAWVGVLAALGAAPTRAWACSHACDPSLWDVNNCCPEAPPPPPVPRPVPVPVPVAVPVPVPHPAEDGVDPTLGRLRRIPGGTFDMGSTSGASEEQPVHRVTVSSFWLMESEVTQGMWRSVMGSNPSSHAGCDECPVENVSWDDATEFARRVSPAGLTYRLPTEAEWEYAARGGASYTYAGSNDVGAVAWTDENAGGQSHPVCTRQGNGYQLCDMSGNVWEWVSDWFGEYSGREQVDPTGPSSGSYRVLRGGGWGFATGSARVAYRGRVAADDRFGILGFRLARSIP